MVPEVKSIMAEFNPRYSTPSNPATSKFVPRAENLRIESGYRRAGSLNLIVANPERRKTGEPHLRARLPDPMRYSVGGSASKFGAGSETAINNSRPNK